jgi:raffinose/stachyose/melibiose transport system permease protein
LKLKKIADIVTYLILAIGIVIILFPLYITLTTALKSPEMLSKDFFSLPSELYLENFKQVLLNSNYLTYLFNSVMITALSVGAIIILVPAVSYAIARNYESKYFRILYYVILAGIFVPMQVILVPEIKLANALGMMTNLGVIPIYVAIAFSSNTFLAVGYIRKIPVEIDESAHIDGAGPIRTFIHIIFPISKTIVATIAILATLWIWNDFLLPLIMLNKNSAYWTLTMFQYNMRDQFAVNYSVSAAAFLLALIPVMIAYIFLQKNIVKGLVQGSVKG